MVNLSQNLRLSQQLLMTPQLQQAIKLLQLSRMELEEFVENQLAENPVLEENAAEGADDLAAHERETTETEVVNERLGEASNIVDQVSGDEKQDVDWDAMARYEDARNASTPSRTSSDEEQPNYENMVTKSATLQEHLLSQAGEVDFNEMEKEIAGSIIGNIDDRGYFMSTVEEVGGEKFSKDDVEGVLDTIQRFDPPGVGARTLQECLLIQLRAARVSNPVIENIIEHHMADLESRNYPNIGRALKIPLDEIIQNVAIIVGLEPIPGRQFGSDATQYIIPDVYVFKLGEEWIVSLNEDGLPRLKVSGFYKDMLKGDSPTIAKGNDRDYLQDKYRNALWLIKSLQQRQNTIFRVTQRIVERQKDFFDYGVQHMKPMILRDIAEDLGQHESTISRATTSKYVHTPRGIFELKYFFSSGVNTTDGENVASEAVKSKLTELIKAEDTKKPLSDQQIVELLDRDGIQLARRTVAKYREQLGIQPSSKRKKYF